MSTTTAGLSKGVLSGGEFIPRVNPEDFFIQVDGKKLTALDIAREAVQLQTDMQAIMQGERDFSTHMLMLASKCESADDFSILCENVSFDMNWGKANPAPKTWVVYRSTIYKAWKDFGVKPLAEMELPQIKGGKLIRDADDEPVRQKTIIAGINQVKKATQALRLERVGEDAEDEETAVDERSPLRVLVDSFTGGKDGIDKEASLLFQSLIRGYVGLDQRRKSDLVRALKRIAADYKFELTSTH